MLPLRLLSKSLPRSSFSSKLTNLTQCRYYATEKRYPTHATVAKFYEFGDPREVLKQEEEPVPPLKPNEVLVRMEVAAMNPSDLNTIEGTYGIKVDLPAIPGNEGVGVIHAVGSGVKEFAVDDLVMPLNPGFGTWRTFAVTTPDQLIGASAEIPLHFSSLISVNPPTALRLLTDFGDLKPGDTIIQNGANSLVGTSIIQIAKARGIRTINVIRHRQRFDLEESQVINNLQSFGGDIVVTDKYLRTPDFKKLLSDIPKPKVAFNCVGGESATEIARNLADGGTLVTYGAMSRRPITLPNSLFIFRNIQCRGFWLTKWLSEHTREERVAMHKELVGLIKSKKLILHLTAYKFSDFEGVVGKWCEPYERKMVWELKDRY